MTRRGWAGQFFENSFHENREQSIAAAVVIIVEESCITIGRQIDIAMR